MSSTCATHVVADPKNGVVTPVYSDRQVVRASDLTLDRASHAQELARMRRLMHGWGVVSGFEMIRDDEVLDTITLGPGYAVAPNGAEIFMPEPVQLTDLEKRIKALCAPGSEECEHLTEDAQMKARAEDVAAKAALGAWLIARPAFDESDPRAGVPQGCENPGNLQLPTRHCHMVRLELLCELPPELILKPPKCSEVEQYICLGPGRGEPVPNPYPGNLGDARDCIVLGYLHYGQITVDAITHLDVLGHGFTPFYLMRRTLLPTAVLQDYLHACVCTFLHARPAEEEAEEPDSDTPVGGGGFVIGRTARNWEEVYGDRWHLREDIEIIPGAEPELPDTGDIDPVPEYLEELIRRKEGLETAGIGGPEDFLRADVLDIVTATGMSPDVVLETKKEIALIESEWAIEDSGPAVSDNWRDFNVRMFDGGVSTNWNATETPAAFESVAEQPLLTRVAESPAVLEEAGLNGPKDVLEMGDRQLAITLGVSEGVARAIKTDMMRFTPVMG